MADLLKQEALSQFFNRQDFVRKTAMQLNKDLNGLSDYRIEVENESESKSVLDFFIDFLQKALQDLNEKNVLQQFIYCVDLPEKEYIITLREDNLNELAHLVLRREAKKVYLKMKFSDLI